jgi:hypothetical protein
MVYFSLIAAGGFDYFGILNEAMVGFMSLYKKLGIPVGSIFLLAVNFVDLGYTDRITSTWSFFKFSIDYRIVTWTPWLPNNYSQLISISL